MIQGIDEDITLVVTPDMKQLLEISTVAAPIPLMEDLMKITTLDEYRSLKQSQDKYFTARNFIPIPPFMLNTINLSMLESDGDIKHVLIVSIQIIREFD